MINKKYDLSTDDVRNEIARQLFINGEKQLAEDVRSLKQRGIVFHNIDTIYEMMDRGNSLEDAVEYVLEMRD